jgi:alpha-tubulin suppressor-like RCC1 family protein
VWSCGAGECGQLGTGRCTNSAVPKQVAIESSSVITDISAGWAHVVATNIEGTAFSWGFNRFGQLGLGDTATRHNPCRILGIKLVRVYAHGNSSAGISDTGHLYTWGSNSNYRLMHGSDVNEHVSTPCPVKYLKDDLVQCFAFSKAGSAAMVLSRLTAVWSLGDPIYFVYNSLLGVYFAAVSFVGSPEVILAA